MKLLYKKIDHGKIIIGLIIEEDDDLWHTYNLLSVNDEIEAFTTRKVHKDIGNNTFVTETKKLVLILNVTKIDFDSKNNSLRVSGKNVKPNDFVKLGQYHTFEICVNDKIKIIKKQWDSLFKEKLNECTNIKNTSKVCILLIDCGHANMYFLTENLCKHVFSVTKIIQKKNKQNYKQGKQTSSSSSHSNNNDLSLYKKSLNSFFKEILNNFVQTVHFEKMECFVLGGPGFFKTDFFNYIYNVSDIKHNNDILNIKNKFLFVKTSSAYKNCLNEIINDENIKKKILNTKVIAHVDILNKFYKYFEKNEEKVCYGDKEVRYASSQNAIESLLITEQILRNCDLSTRKAYVNIVQNVKNSGGKIFIFPDHHTSGEQLTSLTGIAAILKFPIYMNNQQDDQNDFSGDDDGSGGNGNGSGGNKNGSGGNGNGSGGNRTGNNKNGNNKNGNNKNGNNKNGNNKNGNNRTGYNNTRNDYSHKNVDKTNDNFQDNVKREGYSDYECFM
ncbi:PelOta protein homologue, putative [Hepatocystis sp. ex Piliocolobus tephrosceles]|nr:PelOta protein homologue, putative [Hepatocystis sp. ex Piliocolobus tephrosceles]